MVSRNRVLRALVGMALVAPLTAIAAGSLWGGFALAALPAAALISGVMEPNVPGRLPTIGRALVWGMATSLGAVLLFMAATFTGALLGLGPNTPETPLGYLLILILTLVSISPFLFLPLAGVGLGWVFASRWVERRVDGR